MPSKDTQNFHISTGTLVRFLAILAGIAAIYVIRDVIASLIFAIIVASAIEPAIEWLKRYHIPRILGVVLIYVAIASFLVFVVYLVFPVLFDELRSLVATFPLLRERVLSGIEDTGAIPFISVLGTNLEDILKAPLEYLGTVGGSVFGFAASAFGGLFSFVLITIFSFYLAAQEKGIETFLRLITPLQYEPYVVNLWERSQRKLGRWFRVQLLLGALIGVLIFFGLTFLGIKHALFFATLAALFEIIPVVGPILAAVPAVATAFLSSTVLGVTVLALYFVVQQLESHVIVPVVMKKAVGLSPLVVLLAILVGAKLGGIFGILLSVPLTAILAEFLNDWDKKKRALIPE